MSSYRNNNTGDEKDPNRKKRKGTGNGNDNGSGNGNRSSSQPVKKQHTDSKEMVPSNDRENRRHAIIKLLNGTITSSVFLPVVEVAEIVADYAISFTTVWQVNPNDNKIILPLDPTGTYDFSVNWGDGSEPSIVKMGGNGDPFNINDITHKYKNMDRKSEFTEYTVRIPGLVDGFGFNDNPNNRTNPNNPKLREIKEWGEVKLHNHGSQFAYCINLRSTATDTPDLTGVTNMSRMFYDTRFFNGDLSRWNTAAVTNMSGMFCFAHSFNGDLSRWNTAAVTNMREMFRCASSFNGDIEGWNTAAVTNMYMLFWDATSFEGELEGWNTAAVTDMRLMF